MSNEILFIAHRAPWPPDRGDRIRSWRMLEAALKLAPVHVVALADNARDAAIARAKLEPLCASVLIDVRTTPLPLGFARSLWRDTPASVEAFASKPIQMAVDRLLATGRIGTIFAFSGQSAQFVPESFAGRFVMDFVDVDSRKFEQSGASSSIFSPRTWVDRREGRVLGDWERRTGRRANVSLFAHIAEAAVFTFDRHVIDGVGVIENGVDADYFDPSADFAPLDFDTRPLGPLCVFTGQMDYQPNVDGVKLFAHTMLPQLRERVTAASFAIVGRNPTQEVRALESLPGVTVTGEVPDVRPWLAAADAVVAPLMLARGTQNKLLEAMAMAKPTVASTAAATGIDAEAGRHMLVADNAEFVEAVAGLLMDRPRGKLIGMRARQRMIERYTWEATLRYLPAMLGFGDGAAKWS